MCKLEALNLREYEREKKEEKKGIKAETRMTASILKQDPNIYIYIYKRLKKNAIYWDKTKRANFRGNPLCQDTRRHLNC